MDTSEENKCILKSTLVWSIHFMRLTFQVLLKLVLANSPTVLIQEFNLHVRHHPRRHHIIQLYVIDVLRITYVSLSLVETTTTTVNLYGTAAEQFHVWLLPTHHHQLNSSNGSLHSRNEIYLYGMALLKLISTQKLKTTGWW